MGCTASKSLEMQARMDGWSPPISRSFVRSLSMPLRQHKAIQQDDKSHVVALTSTTYGALAIPEEIQQELQQVISSSEQHQNHHQHDAVELVNNPEQEQQVRIQSSKSGPGQLQLVSVPEAEVIDLSELMKDLNEDDEKQHQRVFRKRKSSSRVLSRSISSVDSMRELDVKIRSVALALPNVEKKLLALDALNFISRSEQQQEFRKLEPMQSPKTSWAGECRLSPPRKKKQLSATKSMKGLFYGETLPAVQPSPRNDSSSTTTMASSLDCSSSSSLYDASSSGDSEESTSSSLFDPEILKQFREYSQGKEGNQSPRSQKKRSFFDEFPAICPPKGEDRAVLYVTSLRGIRKTFEDCGRVRMILQGFGIAVDERDVSMHAEFREELKDLLQRALENGKPGSGSVPRLFIKGRYVGGVEEVGQLNEEGVMSKLVEGMSKSSRQACEGCGGVRFVPCFECSGSCKVVVFGGKVGDFSGSGVVVRCAGCNENGLIRCPVCL